MSAQVQGKWKVFRGEDLNVCYFYPNGKKDYIIVRLMFDDKVMDIQQDSVKVLYKYTNKVTEEFFDAESQKILNSKKRNKCYRMCDIIYEFLE